MRPLLLIVLLATASTAAAAEGPRWQAAAGGGIVTGARDGDQPFVTIGITRRLGASGYARLQGSVSGQDGEAVTFAELARETRTLALAGGTRAGRWLVDGWLTAGDRRFDDVLVETDPVTTTNRRRTSGDLFAGGAAVTYAAIDRDGWFAGPFASLEYGRVATRSVERDPAGTEVFRTRLIEEGVTGALGASVERALPGTAVTLIGSAAGVLASNARSLAERQVGLPGGGAAGPLGESGADLWAEVSAGALVRLGGGLSLFATVAQTAGFAPDDTTAVAARLRLDF